MPGADTDRAAAISPEEGTDGSGKVFLLFKGEPLSGTAGEMRPVPDSGGIRLLFQLYKGGGTGGDREADAEDAVVLSAAFSCTGGDSAYGGLRQQVVSGTGGIAVGYGSIRVAGACRAVG